MSDDAKNAKSPDTGLLSAMTTEHFIMQTAISTATSEAVSRAMLYIMTLSSSLVAMGFAADSEAFVPFAASVLPAVFLLGIFTALRMVDVGIENMQAYIAIARIRSFYRTLGPEAAHYFAATHGRWPEKKSAPSLRIGILVGYVTTAAMMIATMNAIVAGAAVTFLARWFVGPTAGALMLGIAIALIVLALFYFYQRWRIGELSNTADDF